MPTSPDFFRERVRGGCTCTQCTPQPTGLPFLRSLFTSTLSINGFTGFRVHALSAEGYLSASCISAITLTSSLGSQISLMQAMKPDRGSHVTMTFSKATRLWSNSGKSSSSSCDSRAVSSATARKSLACEASARGRGRAAESLPTTPAPASAVSVAASKAKPPTQQLGQMSLSAARSFPPAKGTGGCGGGRREDRRSRRDEQDYNPINTRPVDRENKQGLTGEQIDIVANYFALRTLPEWRIYQHMVEFSPDIPMIRMRRRMIREHDDVLGKTVAFDGTILYLTKRLPEESVTLTSKKVTDGSMVTITINTLSQQPFDVFIRSV